LITITTLNRELAYLLNSYSPYMSYTFFPLGDAALTISFGNVINEETNAIVLSSFYKIKKAQLPFVLDVVPAYSSLTVHYDVVSAAQQKGDTTVFELMVNAVENAMRAKDEEEHNSRYIKVPVFYEPKFALDIADVAAQKGLSVEDVMHLHLSKKYRVYMVGFLPGFAYMGKVDERISVPRKAQPRTHLPAGSVGIAGEQTGIYPLASPGGWQIIGCTPVQLFNKDEANPVLFQPGDVVEFFSITEHEFTHY
jgi:inhibitor of KinA